MREEISEPQHWRSHNPRSGRAGLSWSSRRGAQERTELVAEAVDAALAEDGQGTEEPNTKDIISSLSSQLELLEQQREQIQRMLAQAQAKE